MIPASSYRTFAVLWVVSLLIWWQAIAVTLALALRQDAYTHILLILPISIGLIVTEWHRRKWKPSPSIRIGSALLGLAVLIGVAGLRWGRVGIFTGDVRPWSEMLAVVMWWIGSFVVCFGGGIFRACVFPLFFLLWLVPMPEFALAQIMYFLQQGTASFARLLLATAGVPVAQDGMTLTVPGLALEIAQECSSIRSSMMLVVITMVMSYLLLRSFWGRTVVTLAAIPLSICKNGLRVFTLAVLGAYVDRGILDSPLHHQGGILFFAVSLAGVFLAIWMVDWAERKAARTALKEVTSVGVSAEDRAFTDS
jgi:exosortase